MDCHLYNMLMLLFYICTEQPVKKIDVKEKVSNSLLNPSRRVTH